jgi:hypothetical protein
MAESISVPAQTTFFAGYLDAVGRHYTDDQRLCALTAILATSGGSRASGTKVTVVGPVENMVKEFEREISRFLSTDPRKRLVFYLTEYFCWYRDFTSSCVCQRVTLEGEGITDEQLGFRLYIDNEHEVLFLAYWKDKSAMPNTWLERTRGE